MVNCRKVLLHPSHIKLGLMQQFVKALHQHGDCFNRKFLDLSCEKIKAGVFDGPKIRGLLQDEQIFGDNV